MLACYSRIILYAFRYLLFSKLCSHNVSRPIHQAIQYHWILDGLPYGNYSGSMSVQKSDLFGMQLKLFSEMTYQSPRMAGGIELITHFCPQQTTLNIQGPCTGELIKLQYTIFMLHPTIMVHWYHQIYREYAADQRYQTV